MGSLNAEQVAKEIIKTASKGKLIDIQKITEKHGYSRASARAQNAKRTKTYKKIMRPIAEGLQDEIERIKAEMASRNISRERYIELAKVMDIYIKNHQLLSGKPTEITKQKFDEQDLDSLVLIYERNRKINVNSRD